MKKTGVKLSHVHGFLVDGIISPTGIHGRINQADKNHMDICKINSG
jgi:hypothetical protein